MTDNALSCGVHYTAIAAPSSSALPFCRASLQAQGGVGAEGAAEASEAGEWLILTRWPQTGILEKYSGCFKAVIWLTYRTLFGEVLWLFLGCSLADLPHAS